MLFRKTNKVLDKKVPKSQKYAHINSAIDTGKTMKHVEILSNKTASKRKGELFRRIRCSTLAKILENIRPSNLDSHEEFKEKNDDLNMGSRVFSESPSTFSVMTVNTDALGITEDSEFVVLDLREIEEYNLFHIKESLCFPAPNITRDVILPEVFRLRNKPGKFIIVYTWDERPGVEAAQKFSQRGYENVYLLSGGIREFVTKFPYHVEGDTSELSTSVTKK